jgi:hypothetical protein
MRFLNALYTILFQLVFVPHQIPYVWCPNCGKYSEQGCEQGCDDEKEDKIPKADGND